MLCLISGGAVTCATPALGILFVNHSALIAVLGRARFDLTVRFSAIRCESTFLFLVVHLGVRSGPRLPLVSFLGFRLTTFPGGISTMSMCSLRSGKFTALA